MVHVRRFVTHDFPLGETDTRYRVTPPEPETSGGRHRIWSDRTEDFTRTRRGSETPVALESIANNRAARADNAKSPSGATAIFEIAESTEKAKRSDSVSESEM